MFGFEQLLLQVTATESINEIILAATGLITSIGVIIGAFIKFRSQGRQLTEAEKKILSGIEYSQIGVQKTKESIGEIGSLVEAVYNSLPEESKQKFKEQVQPILDASSERIEITDQQARLFAKIFGINVDDNTAVPRESKAVLEQINKAVDKAQFKAINLN